MKSKLFILLVTFASLPLVALAGGGEGFVPLVGIPGLPSGGDFDGYIDALYALAISIAALVAVVKIILAGAKYMMDDIVTHKSQAKEDIKNALIGLLIIIGAVIILNTINSDLTNLEITAPPVELDNSTPERIDDLLTEEDVTVFGCIAATNEQWQRVNATGSSCRERCNSINGLYTPQGSLSSETCTVSTAELEQLIEEASEQLAEEHCPEGVTNCEVSYCEVYGDGGALNLTSCQQFCTARGGVYYNQQSGACVIAGTTDETQLSCGEPIEYGDPASGVSDLRYDCTSALEDCSDRGGYSAGGTGSAANITCIISDAEVSDEITDAVCSGQPGYTCEVTPCGATGVFEFCSSWCWDNGQMFYNRAYGVCYSDTRPSN